MYRQTMKVPSRVIEKTQVDSTVIFIVLSYSLLLQLFYTGKGIIVFTLKKLKGIIFFFINSDCFNKKVSLTITSGPRAHINFSF